jgi:hypothetical protein
MNKYLRITNSQANGAAVDLTSFTAALSVAWGDNGDQSANVAVAIVNAPAGIIQVNFDPLANGNCIAVVDCGVASLAAGDRYREVVFEQATSIGVLPDGSPLGYGPTLLVDCSAVNGTENGVLDGQYFLGLPCLLTDSLIDTCFAANPPFTRDANVPYLAWKCFINNDPSTALELVGLLVYSAGSGWLLFDAQAGSESYALEFTGTDKNPVSTYLTDLVWTANNGADGVPYLTPFDYPFASPPVSDANLTAALAALTPINLSTSDTIDIDRAEPPRSHSHRILAESSTSQTDDAGDTIQSDDTIET